MKISIGKNYFRESDGTYIVPLRKHFSDFECKLYELDEDGNETNVQEVIMSAHDILKK